jgi:hypothetical protein
VHTEIAMLENKNSAICREDMLTMLTAELSGVKLQTGF